MPEDHHAIVKANLAIAKEPQEPPTAVAFPEYVEGFYAATAVDIDVRQTRVRVQSR